MANEPTLYLVDASAFIFKNFHGMRERLSTSDGQPVQAVFGYMRLLLKVLKQRGPSHIVVAFDSKGPTFRKEIYSEYKANRPPPPPTLPEQYELCVEGTHAMGLKSFSIPGLEADDIIGTLATLWQQQTSGEVVIIGTDKDMMQLVNERVSMWDGADKTSGKAQVIEKFGVRADQVIDLLGLSGDASDNIPGVPGIGPKTAAKLLNDYGDLESIIREAHRIKGKRGENLQEFAEQARLSAVLATIKLDGDLGEPLDELMRLSAFEGPTLAPLESFFDRLGFARLKLDLLSRWPSVESSQVLSSQQGVAQAPSEDFELSTPSDEQSKGESSNLIAATSNGLQEGDALLTLTPVNTSVDRSRYRCITDVTALKEVIKQVREAGILSIDLETTSLDVYEAEVLGIALAWAENEAAYIPIDHFYLGMPLQLNLDCVKEQLGDLLSDPEFPKVCQNHKYDRKVLQLNGFSVRGWYGDPMLMAHLIDPTRLSFGLDALCKELLGHENLTFKEVAGSKGSADRFRLVEVERATAYAAEDADMTLRLYQMFKPLIDSSPALSKLYYHVELPLNEVLADMELRGIKIDSNKLREQSKQMLVEIQSLSAEIQELAGEAFNIDSPKQLSAILFDKLGLEAQGMRKKTATGQQSTRHEVLETMQGQHAIIAKILDYRHLAKLRSTYLEALPNLVSAKTGRLHSSFSQTGTATGRLSSNDPNLQNIPMRTAAGKKIREAFIAAPGYRLISADYSQVELRLLAHFAEAKSLIKGFNEGVDIHAATASELFGIPQEELTSDQRRSAKAINFGLMYGMGPKRLSETIGISFSEAKAMINKYFDRYGEVRAYFSKAVADAELHEATHTLLGRRRPLKEINAKGRFKAQAERLAVNTPIQGTAADILKLAMVSFYRALNERGLQAKMLLTVHDELVIEAPESETEAVVTLLKECMEGAERLSVPLVVEVGVGDNWAEIH